MTAEKLREWRGVKPVAAPSGVAIPTRLRTAAEDEFVLDAVTAAEVASGSAKRCAQSAAAGIRLYAVNPAYTSAWGEQHWRTPDENVTRHQAAATVIGRRAQGHKARRREGVTRTRPADRVVRATDPAAPHSQRATSSRHQSGTRGTKSRPPGRTRTRLPGRATVTPTGTTTSVTV